MRMIKLQTLDKKFQQHSQNKEGKYLTMLRMRNTATFANGLVFHLQYYDE